MSVSLLRKGLELLEAPTVSASRPRKAATTTRSKKQLPIRKKKKIFSGCKRETTTVKGKVTKSVLEEYQKRQAQAVDHFQKNMQYMMNSQFTADSAITQKVLAQNRGRKSRDIPQEEATKKPEGTVFTEEDFQKFEKEYFAGAGAGSPN
ncbi:active regulator of SIRT1 [Eublepharis macularius]|uniref:Active regulator of SIRT1 n=1 Tax=Eublepharis macularius TaxID=481883 RepID=A0AA97JXJ8_EUBMA|nr:active regulator of SIRT1 [Eublepharis macularius]